MRKTTKIGRERGIWKEMTFSAINVEEGATITTTTEGRRK